MSSSAMGNTLSFTTDGPSYVLDLRNRTGPGPRVRLRVYSTRNPSDVPNREALNYLIGRAVLIDGAERVVHSVESFCIGGIYYAGKAIGLAVVENEDSP